MTTRTKQSHVRAKNKKIMFGGFEQVSSGRRVYMPVRHSARQEDAYITSGYRARITKYENQIAELEKKIKAEKKELNEFINERMAGETINQHNQRRPNEPKRRTYKREKVESGLLRFYMEQ